MAVQQLQLPPNQISNLVDQSQWSTLGNLGNVYQAAQDRARQQAALASLGTDPMANTQALIQSGVPELAQLGLGMQNRLAAQAESVREFNARQAIAQAEEERKAAAFAEDTPKGRRAKVLEAGLDPTDKASKIYIASGGNFPGTRTGLGQPTITKDAAGNYHMWQLSSDGTPVEVQFPVGQQPLTPGELAGQKQEAVSLAKSKAIAIAALPKLSDTINQNLKSLDELKDHPGRENATGKYMGQLPDNSPLLSQAGIDFRNRFTHVKSQAYLSAFDTLRGAGAISNQEGEAGKAAVNRLSTVTSANEFNNALEEAKRYYELGLERAQRAAKGDFSAHPAELRPTDYTGATPGSEPAPTPTPAKAPVDYKTYFTGGKK